VIKSLLNNDTKNQSKELDMKTIRVNLLKTILKLKTVRFGEGKKRKLYQDVKNLIETC
jgi:hypothetical protein